MKDGYLFSSEKESWISVCSRSSSTSLHFRNDSISASCRANAFTYSPVGGVCKQYHSIYYGLCEHIIQYMYVYWSLLVEIYLHLTVPLLASCSN